MASSLDHTSSLLLKTVLFCLLVCELLPSGLTDRDKTGPQVTYKYCLSLPNEDNIRGFHFDCSKSYLEQIPDFLPTSTVDLYLYSNQIKRLDKNSFQPLSNLKRLNLSDNSIRVITEESFLYLPHLEVLDLSFNGIRAIPCKAFSLLNSLKVLRILDVVSLEFESCSWDGVMYLTSLEMSFYFENKSVDDFRGLKNIETLRLWVNYERNDTDPLIHNCLNISLFNNLPNLKHLDLSFGKFSCLEGPAISDSNRVTNGVTELDIRFNINLTEIKPSTFIAMKNLRHLNLESSFRLGAIEASAFAGLHGLDCLILNNGALLTLNENQFTHLKNIKILDLAGFIKVPTLLASTFRGLSQLMYLNLSLSSISVIEPSTFDDLYSLVHLDLSLNELSSITSQVFRGLKSLSYLNIVSYPITIRPSTFQKQNKLEYLCLSNDMKIDALEPFQFLTSLDWQCPFGIDHLAPKSFCGIYLFYYLSVSKQYSTLSDWISYFPSLRKIRFFTLEGFSSAKFPLKLELDTITYLTILPYKSDTFVSISLFIPQDVDLLQDFNAWFRYVSEEKSSNLTLSPDEIVPKLIKNVFQNSKIQSLNLTIAKYLMPVCDFNENIEVETLFYNSGTDTMENVFSCFKGIRTLYLNNSASPLRYLERETFRGLDSLQVLDLSRNNIVFVSEHIIRNLPKLKYLNMFQNSLSVNDDVLANFSTLSGFRFDWHSEIYSYSRGCCRELGAKYFANHFPFGTSDCITQRQKRDVCNFYYPDKVWTVCAFRKNDKNGKYKFYDPDYKIMCNCDPTKMHVLHMRTSSISFSANEIWFVSLIEMKIKVIDRVYSVLHVPSLIYVDLSYSTLNINNAHIKFKETDNIKVANFSHTQFDKRNVYEQCNIETNQAIFQSFVNSEFLNVSYSGITYLCKYYFQQLTSLKVLDVSNNEIEFVGNDIFAYNSKLETLDLSSNKLSIVDPRVFDNLTMLSLFYFENNPLDCHCEMAIQSWMENTETLSFTLDGSLPWQTYQCMEPKALSGKPVMMIDENRIECYMKYFVPISLMLLIVPIILIGRVLWRKRWHLVYNAYKRINKLRQMYPLYFRLENEREYEFDAFISFCEGDSDWVDEQLQPILEDELKFTLCIHTRDFHGGKDIFANIEENIKKSRKIIFVVSENFVKSSYCDFEMRYAFSMMLHALHNESILVFIMLQKVPQKDMSDILKFFVNTKTYLAWPDRDANNVEREQFWQQLREVVTDEQ
ncbi:toll-like receptor 13 [Ptychodera flava]|uniref:toll-like receptor 13 n=1 Tax=Ptychodera flava TaxID=63121 RepID=UPI00396A198B